MDALQSAGVNIDYVTIAAAGDEEVSALPAIALIAVDVQGNNQIIVLPGASTHFGRADIDRALPLFEAVHGNDGFLVLSVDSAFDTIGYAVEQAHRYGLKVFVDPGGMEVDTDIDCLIRGAYLVKPNLHEARMLTGVMVDSLDSCMQAAAILRGRGAENVLITAGASGAYLVGDGVCKHISVPDIADSAQKDETGCGDQVMATLCAFLQQGKTLEAAATAAVLSGTLQFHRAGIRPVTAGELDSALLRAGG